MRECVWVSDTVYRCVYHDEDVYLLVNVRPDVPPFEYLSYSWHSIYLSLQLIHRAWIYALKYAIV